MVGGILSLRLEMQAEAWNGRVLLCSRAEGACEVLEPRIPDFKSRALFATLLCSQVVLHHFTNI